MNKILIVVDMQNDFLYDALANKEGASLVPKMRDKIKDYLEEGYKVVFTRDTHNENYMETEEGKNLPIPHCIKGTIGWQISDYFKEFITNETEIFDKVTFGSDKLYNYLSNNNFDEIELIGVCTDICVIVNAMTIKTFAKEAVINVHKNLCAGTTIENHEIALKAMSNCQINIVED